MALDGNGNFTRNNGVNTGSTTWTQDAAAGTDILASRHDTHDQEFAAALSLAFYRDGRAAATGNFPMGTNKITGMGDPTSDQDAATKVYVDAKTDSGSFTPTLEASSGSVAAYSAQTGAYHKVGTGYLVSVIITFTDKGTLSGPLKIATLPFDVAAGGRVPVYVSTETTFAQWAVPSGSTDEVNLWDQSQQDFYDASDLSSSGTIEFSGYFQQV